MKPTEPTTRERSHATVANGEPQDFLFRTATRAADPTIARLCDLEEERQFRKLILIASESVCPEPVRAVLASSFNNLYTEGYPSWRMTEAENRDWADFVTHLAYFRRYSDLRYYRGCDYANFAETIAQKRIKELFATDRDEQPLARVTADDIFANVQPLSGAAANNAVYMALVPLGSTVVGMSLVEGGHLTHGSPANRSGKSYKIASYGISPATGRIDYDQVQRLCDEHQPRMLIAGASAYPWHIDWKRLREIADSVKTGCYLLADIAHYAGLVVGKQYPNPIGIADVVSFTTHKSLCGPRGAVILTTDRHLAQKINVAVFPGEQGGPHQGNIAAKAVAFHLAGTATFRTLMQNVVANAKALAAGLERRGVKVCYGGTESHLCLADLSSIPSPTGMKLTGEIAGRVLDLANIVVNKNTVRGDRSAVHPSAIRLGTVWLSQLGYDEKDVDQLADLIATCLKGVHPFRYVEGAGHVGRGKIDLDLLDQVRRGVDGLIESRLGPATGTVSGYPHFDSYAAPLAPAGTATAAPDKPALLIDDPGLGVLEIESDRAHYLLASAGTADLSRLEPGDVARTALLDRHGKLIDDVLVVRLEDRVEGWRRYRMLTNAAAHARVRRWLRALSDGYVLFDDQDVFRKVEGPAMIEDVSHAEPHAQLGSPFGIHSICEGKPLREASAEIVAPLALIGPDAAKALAGASGGKAAPGARRAATLAIGGVEVTAISDGDGAILLLAPAAKKAAVLAGLKGAAAAAGPDAYAAARGRAKLPVVGAGTDAAALAVARPDLFGLEKVYFVGQSTCPAPATVRQEYRWQPAEQPLRQTPLFEEHLRLGDKEFMVPFGGWKMPVRYGSILEEHQAVRTAAGLFDVAHMGVLEVRGPHARRFVDAITSNYAAWLHDGQCQYSYLLDPDGRCIDDILVYRRRHDRILIVVNAANAEKDEAWIRAAATGEYFLDRERKWIRAEGPVEIVNLKDPALGAERRVDLALQGPASFAILEAAAKNPAMLAKLRQKKRFEFVEGSIDGIDALVSTTGYTGEKEGFEILLHPDSLRQIWKLLLEAGEPFGLKPCGLGARDSTRTEAGFPLWGHELAGDHDVTPFEAGYGGSVKLHKPFFVGRGAMLRHEQARTREIVRFKIEGEGKRLVRAGNPIVGGDGKYLGVVTSCTQVGKEQVGLALIDKRSATRGTNLYFYRLPPSADRLPPPKRMDQLKRGDSVLLPDVGQVVKRFL